MSRRSSYIDSWEAPRHDWERREAEVVAERFDTEATVTDGVVRWDSNGRVPPASVLEFWRYLEKPFDLDASTAARDHEQAEFLEEYRREAARRPVGTSGEQRAELLAAFGPGATVTNVITGQSIHLGKGSQMHAPEAQQQLGHRPLIDSRPATEAYDGMLATLRCKGRNLFVDAAENHLIPVVFNNLSGANFDGIRGDLERYLDQMGKTLSAGSPSIAVFSIGDGPVEILLGDRVIASCMIGDQARVTEADMACAMNHGDDRLWWIAEDAAEADRWVTELTAKGCTLIKREENIDRPRVSVVFSLNKNRAQEVLGYQPEETEWLDPETDRKPPLRAPLRMGP